MAVVTGTSRGLGQYFARSLARCDADLVITSRDPETLKPLADEIAQMGILVNHAGMNIRKPALEVQWDDWNKILDTNLRATFFVAQAVRKRMVQRKYGRIINMGPSPA